MDEEVEPDDENVNHVLAQESKELFHILLKQPASVIMGLYQMMPGKAGGQNQQASADPSALTGYIEAMLEYFKLASTERCCSFLQSVCLMCEDIPMLLESRLMSVAGRVISEFEKLILKLMNLLRESVLSHTGTRREVTFNKMLKVVFTYTLYAVCRGLGEKCQTDNMAKHHGLNCLSSLS